MSRNAVLSTLAVLIAALVLLGDATNVRSRRSEHEQHVLAGTVQQGRIEAEQLQKAGECKAAEFPFHQMAVNGANFRMAVARYANKIAHCERHSIDNSGTSPCIDTSWEPHRAAILDWAGHHDFGFTEAVEGNGYKLAPLFDGKGDLVQGIQKKTALGWAIRDAENVQAVKDQRPFSIVRRAQSPFYSANKNELHEETRKAIPFVAHAELGNILVETYGQMHEAYSALLFLDKKYAGKAKMPKYTSGIAQLTFPVAGDVAGMALIAGTVAGPKFGGPLDRIKSLHVAVKLLSASKGSPPHKYSGSEGAAYRRLFEQMEKVVDGTIKLSKMLNGLTIEQWFNGGFVGDFLYLLKYADGSICKQANSLAEFFAYGGLSYSSKKAGDAPAYKWIKETATPQASWNAFWDGQPGIVNGVVPMLLGEKKQGLGMTAKVIQSDKTGRDRAMEAIKQCKGDHPLDPQCPSPFTGPCNNPQIFSTCAAFTQECKFVGGYWQKKN